MTCYLVRYTLIISKGDSESEGELEKVSAAGVFSSSEIVFKQNVQYCLLLSLTPRYDFSIQSRKRELSFVLRSRDALQAHNEFRSSISQPPHHFQTLKFPHKKSLSSASSRVRRFNCFYFNYFSLSNVSNWTQPNALFTRLTIGNQRKTFEVSRTKSLKIEKQIIL